MPAKKTGGSSSRQRIILRIIIIIVVLAVAALSAAQTLSLPEPPQVKAKNHIVSLTPECKHSLVLSVADLETRMQRKRWAGNQRFVVIWKGDFKWSRRRRRNVRTSHVCARFPLARSTAEMSVETREARTWKSRASAVIPPVRLRIRRSRLEVPTSPAHTG